MSCVRQIEETSKAATESLNNTIRDTITTHSNNQSSQHKIGEGNSQKIGETQQPNVNEKGEEGVVVGEGRPEEEEVVERKSETPTEVFNVDWLCVA